jgi:hypothetical protein
MRAIMRLVVVVVSLLAWLPCAQAQGLHRTVLGRGTWPGPNRSVPVREASDVVQVTVTLDAGAVGPWHYHPGPAIVIVEKGEFTLTQDDSNCSTATYVAQEGNHPVVWEDAFNIHRPANLSGAETTIFITFLDIPRDSPDMIAADPQVCNQNSASLSAKAKAVASARPVPHQMQDAARTTRQLSTTGKKSKENETRDEGDQARLGQFQRFRKLAELK